MVFMERDRGTVEGCNIPCQRLAGGAWGGEIEDIKRQGRRSGDYYIESDILEVRAF